MRLIEVEWEYSWEYHSKYVSSSLIGKTIFDLLDIDYIGSNPICLLYPVSLEDVRLVYRR